MTKQNCYYGLMWADSQGNRKWEMVRFPQKADALDWGVSAYQHIVIMPWTVARDAEKQNWPIYRR